MRHADIAMYRAKRTRTGWAEYAAELDGAAELRLHELNDLDQALADGGLHLVYQPIVARRRVVTPGPAQVEALVRWDHPRRGALAARRLPAARAAERPDEHAHRRRRRPRARPTWPAGATRAVTCRCRSTSARRCSPHPGFLPALVRRLRDHGLAPGALCLELTESEVLSPEGRALLEQVRSTGMTVALDDFGTGYSSLSYLADLPLDRLKLDRSFVRRLSADSRMARFVGGLVGLVHGLGLPVIAEGVEQQAEADLLDELGVAYQQGFLHSRPVRAELLPAFWSR